MKIERERDCKRTLEMEGRENESESVKYLDLIAEES